MATKRPAEHSLGRNRDPENQGRIERRKRALEETLDVRQDLTSFYCRFHVRNPLRRTAYWVLLPAFPERDVALCTCPDFGLRGLGTCKHLEAVWLWLSDPEHTVLESRHGVGGPDAARAWREIDRRLDPTSRGPASANRRLHFAGDALFELPTAPLRGSSGANAERKEG